jgi:hypothetical protein
MVLSGFRGLSALGDSIPSMQALMMSWIFSGTIPFNRSETALPTIVVGAALTILDNFEKALEWMLASLLG